MNDIKQEYTTQVRVLSDNGSMGNSNAKTVEISFINEKFTVVFDPEREVLYLSCKEGDLSIEPRQSNLIVIKSLPYPCN
jgi:hypothetical protein